MRVYVEYRVPVLVEVDLDAGRVLSVHVDDESVEGPMGVIDVSPRTSSETEAATAIDLAEKETWPAWEFGP